MLQILRRKTKAADRYRVENIPRMPWSPCHRRPATVATRGTPSSDENSTFEVQESHFALDEHYGGGKRNQRDKRDSHIQSEILDEGSQQVYQQEAMQAGRRSSRPRSCESLSAKRQLRERGVLQQCLSVVSSCRRRNVKNEEVRHASIRIRDCLACGTQTTRKEMKGRWNTWDKEDHLISRIYRLARNIHALNLKYQAVLVVCGMALIGREMRDFWR